MDWLPIKDAPKDGTPVLLCIPGQPTTMTVGAIRSNDAFWQLTMVGAYAEDADVWPDPTHFMPLPSPPKDT